VAAVPSGPNLNINLNLKREMNEKQSGISDNIEKTELNA
jgi:hypothetical protein